MADSKLLSYVREVSRMIDAYFYPKTESRLTNGTILIKITLISRTSQFQQPERRNDKRYFHCKQVQQLDAKVTAQADVESQENT